jgi:hypothetical protein
MISYKQLARLESWDSQLSPICGKGSPEAGEQIFGIRLSPHEVCNQSSHLWSIPYQRPIGFSMFEKSLGTGYYLAFPLLEFT